MSRICYFDIGNSRAKFWLLESGMLAATCALPHDGDVSGLLGALPEEFSAQPHAVLGATVLDEAAERSFGDAVRSHWQRDANFARSSRSCAGVISGYDRAPESLGIDRWLAMLAVRPMEKCVCVVDCGSAITFDVLDSDGIHRGGYILPGLSKMVDVLLRGTRRVRFNAKEQLDGISLGTSTGEAVAHGAIAAIVALAEHLVQEHSAELVLTGGDASRVSRFLTFQHALEPELLLQGLQRYFAYIGIN